MAELTDANKLRLVVDWFDKEQFGGRWFDSNSEVQTDLRRIAKRIEELEEKEVVDYENLLRNLLAVIHRAGGHYIGDHGIVKATKDAMVIVANAIVK